MPYNKIYVISKLTLYFDGFWGILIENVNIPTITVTNGLWKVSICSGKCLSKVIGVSYPWIQTFCLVSLEVHV